MQHSGMDDIYTSEYDRAAFTPPTFSPMSLSLSNTVYTGRTTNCDIMSVINTTRVQKILKMAMSPPQQSATDSPNATLPYKKSMAKLGATLTADTPWTKLQLAKVQRERTTQLVRERDNFMVQLMKERCDEEQLQNWCVIKIQATFRGFRRRPRTLLQHEMRRRKDKRDLPRNSLQGIHEELCSMAKRLRLRTIAGLTLVPKSMQAKRRRKISGAAAMRIQRFFRMLVARRKARAQMADVRLAMKNAMVRIIVRFFKYCFIKSFGMKALNSRKGVSAVFVQNQARAFLARRCVRELRKLKLLRKRQNHASIIITRNYKPFYQRRCQAREAPISDMADEVVAGILSAAFAADLAAMVHQESLDKYSAELQAEASERALAFLSAELADVVFDKEMDVYIEEQISLLEAIRRQMEEERLALEAERLRLELEMEEARRVEEERRLAEEARMAKHADARRQAEQARLAAEKEVQQQEARREKARLAMELAASQAEARAKARASGEGGDAGEGHDVGLASEEDAAPKETWVERMQHAEAYRRFGRYSLALGILSELAAQVEAEGEGDAADGELQLRKALLAVVSASCHFHTGEFEVAREKFVLAEEIRDRVAGRCLLVAEAAIGKAGVCKALGRYDEAEEAYKRAFAILEEADAELSPNDSSNESPRAGPHAPRDDCAHDQVTLRRQFCALYVGIADINRCLGNYDLASSAIESVMQFIEDRFLEGEDEGTEAMSNALEVEAALFTTQGLVQDARITVTEALEMRRGLFGEHHPAVAASLTQLGRLTLCTGDFPEALRLIDEGLAMRRQFFGPESLQVAESLYTRARYLCESGQYPEAAAHMQQSLDCRVKALGAVHHLVAQSQHGLADVARERGLPAEAESSYQAVLAMRHECFPTLLGKMPHKRIIDSGFCLGLNALACGRFHEAAAIMEQTASMQGDLLQRMQVRSHWEVEMSKVALAQCYCQLGRFDEAKNLLSVASKALLDALGAKSLMVVQGFLVLGRVCARQGLYRDSEALLDRCLKVLIAAFGEASPRLLPVYEAISLNMLGPGNYDEAAEACNKGLDVLAASQTPNSMFVLTYLHARAQILRDTGCAEDALALYEQSLVGLRDVFGGENSTSFALVLGELGECLRLQGNLERADIVLNESLRLRSAQYGEGHVLVAETLRSIALMLLDRRQPREALGMLEGRVLPVLVAALGRECPSVMYTRGLTGQCLKAIDAEVLAASAMSASPIEAAHQAQALIDDALDFLDAYPQGRFSDMHPWVLRLGGFVSPDSSRASSAMPASRLPTALAVLRASRPNTSYVAAPASSPPSPAPHHDTRPLSSPDYSFASGTDSPDRFSSAMPFSPLRQM